MSIASTIDDASEGAPTVSAPTARPFSLTTNAGGLPGVDESAATVTPDQRFSERVCRRGRGR